MIRRCRILLFVIWTILYGTLLRAQISPGKLSESHAHLEGISNCTACHDLGNKVPDSKCLNCHTEIQMLMNSNKGYHASQDVKDKDCVKCHNDHHGRKFEMVRFDEEKFDHLLAGYELRGKHEMIDCRACHQADKIDDPKIRERKNTFLGLSQDCTSCHEDFHQSSLGNNCTSCHNEDAFRPAPFFNHDEANFPLVGAHQQVECQECHPISTNLGAVTQNFTNLNFESCISCHEDPHNGKLPGNCIQCHSELSFTTFKGQRGFDHNLTEFTLKGQHKEVGCFDCHFENQSTVNLFQSRIGITEESCISCHEDIHQNKFGNRCSQCHVEDSFSNIKDEANFNHGLTDYPLEGQHVLVDCRECHKDSYLSPLKFNNCYSCHTDYHDGTFSSATGQKDCAECHTLEENFSYTTFGIGDHEETDFPLTGAHLATPCFSCHLSDSKKWTFIEVGTDCINCHQNIHERYLAEKYLPDNKCQECHVTNTWTSISFDHAKTRWAIAGEHKKVDCRECHLDEKQNSIVFNPLFNPFPPQCSQCHKDVHNGQFSNNGKDRCSECHEPDNWLADLFDHQKTSFPLDGVHAEIECVSCHPLIESAIGQFSQYKIVKHECIDCHL